MKVAWFARGAKLSSTLSEAVAGGKTRELPAKRELPSPAESYLKTCLITAIASKTMPVERSAGIIIYRDTLEGRKYLFLRAARDKSTLAHGKTVKDFWDFPKGLLEKGESGIEAARREAEEETGFRGIEIQPDFKHTVQYFTFRTGKPVPKYVAMFLGRVASKAVTLSWEHDEYLWLGYEDAKKRITIPKMKDALEAAEDFLQKNRPKGRV